MRNAKRKTEDAKDGNELPHIDATSWYDTLGAATVLGKKPTVLRQWRARDFGPKYTQSMDRGRCLYLGAWLIEFRRGMIVEPAARTSR